MSLINYSMDETREREKRLKVELKLNCITTKKKSKSRSLCGHLLKNATGGLLLPGFDCLAIFTRNDLDPRCAHHVVGFHFERWVFHDERPDIIAEAVGVEMTLLVFIAEGGRGRNRGVERER